MNKNKYRHLLVISMVAAAVALQGCGTTSQPEARFLRDYKAVTELADTLSAHAPRGFELAFTNRLSPPSPTDFPATEKNVRDYMHSSGGWCGDCFRQAVYRPAAAQAGETNATPDAAKLLEHCFGSLEQAGFTSGQVGYSKTATLGSMEVASKAWANRERTLLVLGQVIANRESGEIMTSLNYWGTLNYRPH